MPLCDVIGAGARCAGLAARGGTGFSRQIRPRRRDATQRLLVLLVSMVLVGQAPSRADAASTFADVEVRNCLLGIVELHDDADRLQSFLPEPFRVSRFYGPQTGAIAVWNFSCEDVSVQGESGPGRFSVVGIQIESPDGPPPLVSYLHNFEYFVVAARTDRADLAEASAGSVLFEHIPDMAFDRTVAVTTLPQSSISVPGTTGDFRLDVAPTLQHPLHDHDNSFWVATPDGPRSAQLTLVNAIDKWCPYGTPGCSRLAVEAGSHLATVVGCTIREDGLGIDHDPVPSGRLRLQR